MASGAKYLRFNEIEPRDYFGKCALNDNLIPDPRSGHRIVVDNGVLYSIGGYNPDFNERENDADTYYPLFKELWRFSLASRKWKKLKTHGPMPVELASHSALLHGKYLVVFGGTGIPFGEAASNKLNICNLQTLVWSHIECTGEPPISIYGHTATLCRNCLYVFGGTTGWEYNAELHRLDLETNTWNAVVTHGERPPGRYRHEVACVGRELFVFGGGRSNEVYGFETIPVVNLDTGFWEVRRCVGDTTHGYPKARRCHSCVQLDNEAYICAGYNGVQIFDDLWVIKIPTMQWTRLSATVPDPVYFHSATVTDTGLMLLYGGVVQIDTRRSSKVYAVWLRVPPLKELCWQKLVQSIADIDRVPGQFLLDAGVPSDLVERLH